MACLKHIQQKMGLINQFRRSTSQLISPAIDYKNHPEHTREVKALNSEEVTNDNHCFFRHAARRV